MGLLTVLLLIIILSVGGLALWLNTDKGRQTVFEYGIGLLQDKLQTHVSADSVSVSLLQGQVRLYNMQINDREDSVLVAFDELHVGIDPEALFEHKVKVTDLELFNADVRMWKDSLTDNYSFVIDAFKKKSASKQSKTKTKKQKMALELDIKDVNIKRLHVKWDVRYKRRKNFNKPKHGAFDANHIDAILSLKARVARGAEGRMTLDVANAVIDDAPSGLLIKQLKGKALISKDKIDISGAKIVLPNTKLEMGDFSIDLKKKVIVSPFVLKGEVLLQDLAKPFAPALSNFTTPLHLSTRIGGSLLALDADDIEIHTPDKLLQLKARGRLSGIFAKKGNLNLQFRNIDMTAKHHIKEQIVMHFAKKMRLKMLRQMRAIGDIRYRGLLTVKYKRQTFVGRLDTQHGYVDTNFTLNGFRRYMTGYIKTPSYDMGKLLNVKKLGAIGCRLDFDLNLSRKTPRPRTALPNGRLPMGTFTARVYNASYGSVTTPEVVLDLNSDGSTAHGYLHLPGDKEYIAAEVKYIQTDERQDVWFRLSNNAQQWLLQESVRLLQERLQARVEADSIDVQLFKGKAHLYGIRVHDRQMAPLLSIDTLSVELDPQALLHHQVHVSYLGIHGLNAELAKDSVDANFRFLTQAVRNEQKHHSKSRKRHSDSNKRRKRGLQLILELDELDVTDMRVKWDDYNKAARKKRKRGAFDVNHVDLQLNMNLGLKQAPDGSYVITIRKLNLSDKVSGLQFDDIRSSLVIKRRMLYLDSAFIKMPQTYLETTPLSFNLRTKQLAAPFGVSGRVVLAEIAQAFAPALSNFTTPLDIEAQVSGGLDDLHFGDIVVKTPEGKMTVTAQGTLRPDNVQFDDLSLDTDNETLMQIVMHFAKKLRLKMVRQMKRLGHVHFDGSLGLQDKNIVVGGELDSDYGPIQTEFTLDSKTQFMRGYLESPALNIGKIFKVKLIKPVDAHIDFDFNINSHAPRSESALPNGRLPQGHVNALIRNIKYGIFRVKKIEASVDSDGSTATGSVVIPRFFSDIILNFNYIQTDETQDLKLRPRQKFHNPFRRKKR